MPQFYRALNDVLLSTLVVLLILLPIGWFWGKRMAKPLEYLAESMTKVGREPTESLRHGLPEGRDEIGVLSSRFSRMLEELEEKKGNCRSRCSPPSVLRRSVALPRASSHEINNPLGGMLNAISTYRKRGNADPMTAKTISLLERGLLQIRKPLLHCS